MRFRSEEPADRQDIHRLTMRAFADPDSEKEPGEAALLAELYECEGYLPEYSVVAEIGGRVVGHAIATRGWLDGDIPLLGLGPLSVDPAHQRRGVGVGLMAEIRDRAARDGERAIVLLGHIEYYNRLGYEPAIPNGIIPSDPSWGEYFMVLNLSEMPLPKGNFRYAEPFGV
ncbi:GNAT family N-acetyltransferase [Paeniglutamicibacter sp. MACA_103]|uniref:GNAT family N-acetyltransferase n=1 Tax=Paeniglutamicibacter sp. MACA_103 TaxID=3377337 RepID=UPI0038954628